MTKEEDVLLPALPMYFTFVTMIQLRNQVHVSFT